MEKQRDKAARRLERKDLPKETGEVEPEEGAERTEGVDDVEKAELPDAADADAQ